MAQKHNKDMIFSQGTGQWMDLTEEEQYGKLFQSLGGDEFREKFPLFAEALDRAGKQENAVGLKLRADGQSENTIMVDYLIYSSENSTLSAHVLGFFAEYTTGTGVVQVKRQDGSVLEQKTFSIANQKFISQLFTWSQFDIAPYLNETLTAQFSLVGVNLRNVMNSGTFEYRIEGYELANTIVKSINVTDPIHKADPNQDVTVIQARRYEMAQARVLAANSDYDYDYRNSSSLLPDQCNNVFLDFSGSASFSDTTKVFKGFISNKCDFWLYCDEGFVGYDMENYEDFLRGCFKKSSDGFQWNLNYVSPEAGENPEKKKLENINWHKVMPLVFKNKEVYFYFHGHFIYGNEGDPSSDEESCFLLTSDLSETANYKKKMPLLKFYVGCLGPDTLITMADGTTKPIKQVKPGDQVKTPGDQAAVVEDLIAGYEEQDLFCLRVNGQAGYTVITGSHVLHTGRGQLPVWRLRMDDEILTQDGSGRVVEELFPVGGGEIYNLRLKEPGEFFADGLLVGDYDIQNTYVYQEPKPTVPEELLKEAEELARYLQEKGKPYGAE